MNFLENGNNFLIGAATAAHQVEGNNIYSDYWAIEQMKYSSFLEPSLDAVNHYNQFKEDIDYMSAAGLNAYRLSIEWARIEPQKGTFSNEAISHYREVLAYCLEKNITPVVTMHHFSSPKWLIQEGGWESETIIHLFARYCEYVVEELGDLLSFVCTINEANMGLQLSEIIKDMMQQAQVGIINDMFINREKQSEEFLEIFGTTDPHTFLSVRTAEGDHITMQAHEAARESMKKVCPHLKIGITLSLHDFQVVDGGEAEANRLWEEEFLHYLPFIKNDDFFGVQNYTRKIIGKEGTLATPKDSLVTQMGYEFYPESIGNVIRKVSKSLSIPLIVTENGVATENDSERILFIDKAVNAVKQCREDGIEVLGYLYWSLLDNFEWQKGFEPTFGLIAVDRKNQKRYPKNSLKFLGSLNEG